MMSAGVLDSPGLLETPSLGPCRMVLRPYQDEAIEAVRNEFKRGVRSTCIVMATGLGKTVVLGMITRKTIEKGGRVLILAHREELIAQAADKLDQLGIEVGIEKAWQRARALYEPDAVVATVQTLQRERLKGWPQDHFKLIITDECHHSTAGSYRNIYKHFHHARHLGVTATADRADEENIGSVFESVAYEYSLWDAIKAPPPGPYLCRLTFVQCGVEIDLRDLRPRQDDYSEADLEARIAPLADTLANAIKQEIEDRQTLVFTPGVKSAQAIATALDSLGLRFDWASGDDDQRADKVKRYKSGELQGLASCQLFTEGFDAPHTSAIVLARPTKSRPLLAQMVGRGTRLAPGKSDCRIIDFAYLTAKHDLVTPIELFDTYHTDSETAQLATDELKSGKPVDLLEAIEKAEAEHQRRQVLRVKAAERQVHYRRVSYDPLSVYDTLGLPWRGSKDKVTNRASDGQVRYLSTFGVSDAENMSKARAGTLIDYLSTRRKAGMATLKQISWAIAKGCDPHAARAMTKDQASEFLDRVFNRE